MTNSHHSAAHRPRVVVLGAGYAGLLAALRASRANADVSVVAPESGWVERTRLHQLAAGQSVRERPLAGLVGRRVTLVRGTAVRLDLETRSVLATDESNEESVVEFDELVYAVGSSSASGVPGVSEHAFTLDSPACARALAARVSEVKAQGGTVVVVGGGLTGVEAASELAESHPGLSVELLTAWNLGSHLVPAAREYIAAALARKGVAVVEQSPVTEVTATHVIGPSGSRRSADAVVWAAGFSVPRLAADAGLAVNHSGQVLVDGWLRSRSHPHVWAAGDSAAARGPEGKPVLQSAYTAMVLGATAGDNITRVLSGQPPHPLLFAYRNWAVTLGRHDGVVQALTPDGELAEKVRFGRRAAFEKELTEKFLSVGSVRAERWVRFFRWPVAPSRTEPAGFRGAELGP